jgi:hypothetical protein
VPPGVALGIGFGFGPPEEALAIQSGFCAAGSITLVGFEVVVVADPAPAAVVFEFVTVDVRNCDPWSLFCDVVWPAPGKTNSAPCVRIFPAGVKNSSAVLNVSAAVPSPDVSSAPEAPVPDGS